MEQRRLRLGDIVDDYCPRERRVTNHAIVAMVEDEIKQTRCTTCDAEHAYKGGQAPRRRKSESTGTLYKAVLASVAEPEQTPSPSTNDMPETSQDVEAASPSAPSVQAEHAVPAQAERPALIQPEHAAPSQDDEPETDTEPVESPAADEGPVHRPLIRAQLPRPEGMKIERTAPEFTIRQNGRGFRRDGNARGAGSGGRGGGHQRFGHGHGQGQQQRGGRGGQQRFGGRKRSR